MSETCARLNIGLKLRDDLKSTALARPTSGNWCSWIEIRELALMGAGIDSVLTSMKKTQSQSVAQTHVRYLQTSRATMHVPRYICQELRMQRTRSEAPKTHAAHLKANCVHAILKDTPIMN